MTPDTTRRPRPSLRGPARPALRTALTALALMVGLLTAPAQAQTTPEADSRCYDPGNAGTVGGADWTGCADMYIVPDLAELRAASNDGSFAIEHGGTTYAFANGANTVFTGQVTSFDRLFYFRDLGNMDLSHWDTSRVTNMVRTFEFAEFNGDISGWDVSNVTTMAYMFNFNDNFNQDISGWDVSNVTNMRSMFSNTSAFNQDIGTWNVANVTDMDFMFYQATAFDQDLSGWDVRQIPSEPVTFDDATPAWTNPDWRPQWGTDGGVPAVTDVIALGDREVYGAGDTIEIVVQFSADIQLTGSGTPTLTLGHEDPGGATARAVFDRIDGSQMVLGYTVPEGLAPETLEYAGADALVLNGAAVTGTTGLAADTIIAVGNGANVAIGNPAAIAVDGTAPEADFADVPDLFVADTAFSATLTSTETITDFDAAQITVTGGTLSSVTDTDSQSRTLTITPDSDAEQITLALAPAVFTDRAGNAAVPPQDLVITADTTAPVFADVPEDIAVATEPGQDSAEVTWTPPTATDDLDGAITPLTASHQPGDRFDLGQTTVTYTATDSSGNAAQASFTVTVTDGEAPQITGLPEDITLPTDPGEITAVVTWDAPTATDNSGSVTLSADHAPGDTFALGDTLVTYTATDGAGLETSASFTVTVERRDYLAGETQVTTSPDRILANGTDQSEITVTLYDDVGYPLGYGGASVVLATTLGQLGPVSDRGDGRYTATLTSGIRSGEAEIAVTLDGEPVAEGLVTFEVDTAFVVAEVTERTRAFSQRRLTRTFASQPRGLGLDRRRSETPGLRYAAGMNARGGGFAGSLSFSGRDRQRPSGSFSLVDSSGAGLSGSTSLDASWMDAEGRWHGWAELAWSRHEAEAVSGSYGVLHLGVDRLVTEDLAIGLMLSLDRMEEDDGPNDSQEGTGWLAGPYLLAELREGLFVSARLAWGRAEDSGRFDIYDSGFPWTGDRSTRRALATLALYGSTDWRALTLTPQVELLWGRERIGAFTVTDGFGTARVPEAEVWAARLALSTRVEWATEALNAPALAFVTPTLNWDTGSETSGTRPSAALELGLRSTGRGPWSGEISLAADGLGDDNLDAWTLRLSAARRF
ncbi:BspA family leucine-rich repeat surface protein [Ferrimonas balearica]|nr:BspA family leucine-rich repeat surface protein [Ferrimonas balearica]